MVLADARLGGVDDLHQRGAAEDVEVAREGVVGRSEASARHREGVPRARQAGEATLVEPDRRGSKPTRVVHPAVHEDEDHEGQHHDSHRRPRDGAPPSFQRSPDDGAHQKAGDARHHQARRGQDAGPRVERGYREAVGRATLFVRFARRHSPAVAHRAPAVMTGRRV